MRLYEVGRSRDIDDEQEDEVEDEEEDEDVIEDDLDDDDDGQNVNSILHLQAE